MAIRILITGGTFDKQYDAIAGKLTFKDTHLPEILRQVRCTAPYVLEVQQLIDSLEMRDAGRQAILRSARDCPEGHVVITHGTDTMVDTAAVLGRAGLDKTVVLTGAMVPYAFGNSDALFNLGAAIAAVQTLPRGVWIAMNGRLLAWDNARKNRDAGVFEPLEA